MNTKIAKDKLYAKGLQIEIYTDNYESEFISLTDIAKYKSDEPNDIIKNWLRNIDTLEFLGLWESLNNLNFKPVEFDMFRNQAGLNAFTVSPKKWIDSTNAIGIRSKAGIYGGTYAHSDIAFEFASWISPELSPLQVGFTYATEADLLNVALFRQTAKQWKSENQDKKGNIRDYANINELLVLSNMENYNPILIEQGMEQSERILTLNKFAKTQLKSIENLNTNTLKELQ